MKKPDSDTYLTTDSDCILHTESNAPATHSLIRDMAADDRPREKALRHGIKTLTDAELMAILFSTGVAGISVLDLCRNILHDYGNHLSELAKQSATSLVGKYKGVGTAKAITLLAALELGSRAAADSVRKDNPVINTSQKAAEIMRPHFSGLSHEEVWVMLLSQQGKILCERRISEGGISSTIVDIRILLKTALDFYSSSLILFHNHPSGSLKPSPQDDTLTRRVKDGCQAVDIRLNDHIIITPGGYYSYNDEGRL